MEAAEGELKLRIFILSTWPNSRKYFERLEFNANQGHRNFFKCATFPELNRHLKRPLLHLVESSTSTQSQLNSTLDIFTIYVCVRFNAHYLPAPFWLADFLVVATFSLAEFIEPIHCSGQCAKEMVIILVGLGVSSLYPKPLFQGYVSAP